MDNRKSTALEWRRFEGGPPEPPPSSPPDISWSSSSGGEDISSAPLPDRRRGRKRRPLDRVVTRLDFDEGVLSYRRNRVWVSPRVRRSVLRGDSQLFEAVEGRLVSDVAPFTSSSSGTSMERIARDVVTEFVKSPSSQNCWDTQLPLITPLDSISQQRPNEGDTFIRQDTILCTPKRLDSNVAENRCVQNVGEKFVSPVIKPSKWVFSKNERNVAPCLGLSVSKGSPMSDVANATDARKDVTDSCAILVLGKGKVCKLPVARSNEGGSPQDGLSPSSKDSTIPTSSYIIPKSPIIRFKKQNHVPVKKDASVIKVSSPLSSCDDIVPKSPAIRFKKQNQVPVKKDAFVLKVSSPLSSCDDIVPKSPVIRFKKQNQVPVRKDAPVLKVASQLSSCDDIVPKSPRFVFARRRKRTAVRNQQAVPKSNVICSNRLVTSPVIGRTKKNEHSHVAAKTRVSVDKPQFSGGDRNEVSPLLRQSVSSAAPNNSVPNSIIRESPHTGGSYEIVLNSPIIVSRRRRRVKTYTNNVVPNTSNRPTACSEKLALPDGSTKVVKDAKRKLVLDCTSLEEKSGTSDRKIVIKSPIIKSRRFLKPLPKNARVLIVDSDDSQEDLFGGYSAQGGGSDEKSKPSLNDEDSFVPSTFVSRTCNNRQKSKASKLVPRVNTDALQVNDSSFSFKTPKVSLSPKIRLRKVSRTAAKTPKISPSSDCGSMNISVMTEDSPLLDNVADVPTQIEIECYSSQELSAPKSPITVTTISDIPRVGTSSSFSDETGSPVKRAATIADMDSAKKRKRVRKGGYADRLRKLMDRQKSLSRMFQHEAANGGAISCGRGRLMSVDQVWEEYERMMVRCTDVGEDLDVGEKRRRTTSGGEQRSEDCVVLILDAAFVPTRKLVKVNTVLKIFPPWETLTVPKMNATFFLNLINVQVLPSGEVRSQPPRCARKKRTLLSQFFCPCIENNAVDKTCAFRLPRNGLEFMEVLFPSKTFGARRSGREDNSCETIAEMLANRGNDKLIISVQRVFHHRGAKESPGVEKEGGTERSILGRDCRGEFCVVSFGSQTVVAGLDEIALGSVYAFNGFAITKRISRDKEHSLWAIIDSKTSVTKSEVPTTTSRLNKSRNLDVSLRDNELNSEHLFLYILMPIDTNWSFKTLDTFVHAWALSWLKPQVTNLSKILRYPRENKHVSFSIIVKVLHTASGRLYVTDASLVGNSNSQGGKCYATVSVRPSCLVSDVDGGSKVFLFQDVQLYEGQLLLDKYSRVLSATRSELDRGLPLKLSNGLFTQTRSLRPVFPHVDHSSVARDLVTVRGSVLTVDTETASEWPACIVCNNDILAKISDRLDVMYCDKCGQPTRTRTNLSLEVTLMCPSLPQGNMAVVMLLQPSIVKLLSHSGKNKEEGYTLDEICGQEVGPLLGLVLRVELKDREMCFFIQEIENCDDHT